MKCAYVGSADFTDRVEMETGGGSHLFPKYWYTKHETTRFFSWLQSFALFYMVKSIVNTGTIWDGSTVMMLTSFISFSIYCNKIVHELLEEISAPSWKSFKK